MRRLAFVLLLAGCYTPKLTNGQFTCSASDTRCPSGMTCVCNVCTADPNMSCDGGVGDMSMPTDMPRMDMPPGNPCTNGMPASADPHLSGFALCPAAWTVPGLRSTSTPCNRQPGTNGMKGGTGCTALDNCGVGWHLCAGEAELGQRGFDAGKCAAVTGQELYVTLQQGSPPMPDGGGPPMGPPQCKAGENHIVFGCGGMGGPIDTSFCTIQDKSLVDKPGDGTDDCATSTSNLWSCGATGLSMGGAFEIDAVVKPATAGGGVMCCAD